MTLSLRRQMSPDMVVDIWRAADGWPLRQFQLKARAPQNGSILFLGGRGDFLEKYLESFDHWAADGWNVAGFDWRGQGGSGRTHPDGLCHVGDFAAFIDDLEACCRHWQSRTSSPHIAIGHSMGGHILLRAAAEGRVQLEGIVLLSPMIGVRAGPLRGRALNGLAAVGRVPAMRDRAIWSGPSSPAPGRVTSCPERQADKLWWKAQRPELGRGGPTWGWLAAAARSMTASELSLRRSPLALPGLMLSAAKDPIVDLGAIERVRRHLPQFQYGVIDKAGHELLRESDGPRGECWRWIDAYLAERIQALNA